MLRNTVKELSCGISLAQKVNSTCIEKLFQNIKATGLGNGEAFVQRGREQLWWFLRGRGVSQERLGENNFLVSKVKDVKQSYCLRGRLKWKF